MFYSNFLGRRDFHFKIVLSHTKQQVPDDLAMALVALNVRKVEFDAPISFLWAAPV